MAKPIQLVSTLMGLISPTTACLSIRALDLNFHLHFPEHFITTKQNLEPFTDLNDFPKLPQIASTPGDTFPASHHTTWPYFPPQRTAIKVVLLFSMTGYPIFSLNCILYFASHSQTPKNQNKKEIWKTISTTITISHPFQEKSFLPRSLEYQTSQWSARLLFLEAARQSWDCVYMLKWFDFITFWFGSGHYPSSPSHPRRRQRKPKCKVPTSQPRRVLLLLCVPLCAVILARRVKQRKIDRGKTRTMRYRNHPCWSGYQFDVENSVTSSLIKNAFQTSNRRFWIELGRLILLDQLNRFSL